MPSEMMDSQGLSPSSFLSEELHFPDEVLFCSFTFQPNANHKLWVHSFVGYWFMGHVYAYE